MALMNAPFEPDGWSRAITAIAHATRSETAHLAGIGGPLLLPLNIIVGRDADRVANYCARPEIWGPANWRLRCADRPMTIQHEPHYDRSRALGGTADYDDAVADLDMRYGCQATLIGDESNFLGLALLRGGRTGPCEDVTLKRFGYLIRLVQRAVRVQLALDGEAAELLLGDVHSLNNRLILLDRHGCLSALTPTAEDLLADGSVKLSGLCVRLRDAAEDRQLQCAMARLLSDCGNPSTPQVHEMKAGRSAAYPAGQWRLSVTRLPQLRHGLGFNAQIALNFRAIERYASSAGEGWNKRQHRASIQ